MRCHNVNLERKKEWMKEWKTLPHRIPRRSYPSPKGRRWSPQQIPRRAPAHAHLHLQFLHSKSLTRSLSSVSSVESFMVSCHNVAVYKIACKDDNNWNKHEASHKENIKNHSLVASLAPFSKDLGNCLGNPSKSCSRVLSRSICQAPNLQLDKCYIASITDCGFVSYRFSYFLCALLVL